MARSPRFGIGRRGWGPRLRWRFMMRGWGGRCWVGHQGRRRRWRLWWRRMLLLWRWCNLSSKLKLKLNRSRNSNLKPKPSSSRDRSHKRRVNPEDGAEELGRGKGMRGGGL